MQKGSDESLIVIIGMIICKMLNLYRLEFIALLKNWFLLKAMFNILLSSFSRIHADVFCCVFVCSDIP